MRLLHDLAEILHRPRRIRILEQQPGDILVARIRLEDVTDLEIEPQRGGSGGDDADGLGVYLVRDEDTLALVVTVR